MTGDIPQSYSA